MKRGISTIAATICLALVIPAAAQGSSRGGSAPTVVNPPGLPQTGSLFGAYTQVDCIWNGCTRQEAQIAVEDQQALRLMALDRQFYLWDDSWPTADDTWSASGGRSLILSWDPVHANGTPILWADITAGLYDATIDAQAAKVKAFPFPFYFVFHHEPGNAPPAGGSFGTPDQFIAAWRHVHDRFVAAGVTNVRWMLVLFASTYKNGKGDLYYPGDKYVDILSADGYNWYQCGGPWESFQTVFSPYYNFGIAHRKPMIAAEWGTGEDPLDPNRKAQWFTDALATAKTWPELKGISYYNSGRNPLCLRWINTSPESLDAFRSIGADPWFNPAPDTTPPVTSLDTGPPSSTVATSATFTFSANELGVRYSCKLDTGLAAPCYDFAITYSGLSAGSHTFSVTATDYSGNVGSTQTWTWNVVAPTLGVTIKDSGFVPKTASSTLGRSIKWTVNSGATQTHQVMDGSGMGLFTSPVLSAGQTYSFTFISAGGYKYKDNLHSTLTATINVPVGTFPLSGSSTASFIITWATAAPPAGYVFDVQIMRPGGPWVNWKTAQTAVSSTFVPDGGVGMYTFRGRYHNTTNGKNSSWSPGATISIS